MRRYAGRRRLPRGSVVLAVPSGGVSWRVAVAAVLAGAALGWWVSPARGTGPEPLPPCGYEDGSGGPLPCYWDANSRGNGRGLSYVIDRAGGIHYADDSGGVR